MVELGERNEEHSKNQTVSIKVCMGTSCFVNGNAHNLDFIRNYIQEHGINAQINVCGSRCEGKCSTAPNVIINDEIITTASPIRLESVLKKYL